MPKWVHLHRLVDTAIVRHQEVKDGCNPFDPRWGTYGEDLRSRRPLQSMAYRKQWAALFLARHGKCGHRGGDLSEETGWHDHQLIPRVVGGSDSLSNRVPLHPVCHVQVHANGLRVVKPASE